MIGTQYSCVGAVESGVEKYINDMAKVWVIEALQKKRSTGCGGPNAKMKCRPRGKPQSEVVTSPGDDWDFFLQRTVGKQIKERFVSAVREVKDCCWRLARGTPREVDGPTARKPLSELVVSLLSKGEIAALTTAMRQLGVGSQEGTEPSLASTSKLTKKMFWNY